MQLDIKSDLLSAILFMYIGRNYFDLSDLEINSPRPSNENWGFDGNFNLLV